MTYLLLSAALLTAPAPAAPPMQPALKTAVVTFLAGATADNVATYWGLRHDTIEANPTINWLGPHSKLGVVILEEAIDVTGTWLVLKIPYVRHHQRLAAAGFFVASSLRFSLAGLNIHYGRWCDAHGCRGY